MPQLDTLHIFITLMWTWFMLCMIMKKTKTIMITGQKKNMYMTKTSPTMTLPWT